MSWRDRGWQPETESLPRATLKVAFIILKKDGHVSHIFPLLSYIFIRMLYLLTLGRVLIDYNYRNI